MAIIIGDIHGDLEKVKAFLAYKPEAEHVFLGDLVDSRGKGVTIEDELACLDVIFSSETVLLWGNHDLSYTEERPWRPFTSHFLSEDYIIRYTELSDYLKQIYKENGNLVSRDIFTDRYRNHRSRIKAAHAADGWLCTHAGIAPGIASIIPPEVIIKGSAAIAAWINDEFFREFKIPVHRSSEGPQRYGNGPLFQVHYCRGGTDRFGGIFWYDPIGEMTDPSPLVGQQIFAHTPVPCPEIGPHWVNLNCFEDGIWVFDTDTCSLVNIISKT
jgi:hypothetical protein